MSRPPLHTDEPVDRFFSRPVARLLVVLLARTPITPNGVTVLAACCGVAAGASLYLLQGAWAAGWLTAFLVLDCADGQLARLRGGGSYLGRAVDGLGDYATGSAVHLGLLWWLIETGLPVWAALLLVVAAALSMTGSSFLLDRYKHRYRGDMDDLEAIHREVAETGGFRGYLIGTLIPYATRLVGGVRVPDLAAYQVRTRAAFHLWRLCGPTMHFTAMILCFAAGRPRLYVWLTLGPFTLWTLAALVLQRHLEARVPAVIERG
jgi:phosphatidylglycerophosphate synthase